VNVSIPEPEKGGEEKKRKKRGRMNSLSVDFRLSVEKREEEKKKEGRPPTMWGRFSSKAERRGEEGGKKKGHIQPSVSASN